MADKIFGTDFTDTTNPAGTETISINDGSQLLDVTLSNVVAKVTANATNKSTPVDADRIPLSDSAASNVLKYFTWANLKTTLNAVYDWATVTHAATGKTTPVDADELSIVDSAASNVIKKLTWANLKATLKTYFDALYPSGGTDGWITGTGTWSYSSADSPTFVISINADVTALMGVGDRIKLTQTTAKYFIVTAVGAFSAGATLVTVYGGTDYTLANASITSPYYSHQKVPFGFPASREKWTVTLTVTSNQTQTNPTQGTYYNLGSQSIVMPIGSWDISIMANGYLDRASGATMIMQFGISTSNNSVSDSLLMAEWAMGTISLLQQPLFIKPSPVVRASKATYYFLGMSNTASAVNLIAKNIVIQFVCTYL